MGDPVMTLGEEELNKIGAYVQSHLPEWLARSNVVPFTRDRELDLVERMVRVEVELKSQRELMKQGFESMDRRFESMQKQMDERFESMDKRFESMQKQMDERFGAMDMRFSSLQKQMDSRFEAVDKRFESMDKRFSSLQWFMGIGFTMLAVLFTVYNYL